MKRLARSNNKWIDRNDDNKEFKGHVMKDLEKGDILEFLNEEGMPVKIVIENKVTTNEGYLIMQHSEVK